MRLFVSKCFLTSCLLHSQIPKTKWHLPKILKEHTDTHEHLENITQTEVNNGHIHGWFQSFHGICSVRKIYL